MDASIEVYKMAQDSLVVLLVRHSKKRRHFSRITWRDDEISCLKEHVVKGSPPDVVVAALAALAGLPGGKERLLESTVRNYFGQLIRVKTDPSYKLERWRIHTKFIPWAYELWPRS